MKPRIKYRRQGKKSYLARRRRCVAGLAVSLAVLRWRPVAVSWLTDGGSKQRCCCSSGREREISSSSPLLWFFRFFFLCFVYPWLSLCPLGFVLKKLPSPVSSFPLLFPLSLYFISLFGSFFPPPSFSLFSRAGVWVLFIGQRERGVSLSLCMGSGHFLPYAAPNEVANRCGWQGASLGVSSMKGYGAMGCDRSVQREREVWRIKQTFLSSPAARPGEEGGGTMSLKTTPFCSPFFFSTWNGVVLDKTRRFI